MDFCPQAWAEIIVKHCTVAPNLQFDEKALVKAIKSKWGLANSLDIQWNDIPSDHNGIFHQMLTKNGTRSWYYYATTSGNGPNIQKIGNKRLVREKIYKVKRLLGLMV
jgi:hypothetical protein